MTRHLWETSSPDYDALVDYSHSLEFVFLYDMVQASRSLVTIVDSQEGRMWARIYETLNARSEMSYTIASTVLGAYQ